MWNDSIIETFRVLEAGVCEVDLAKKKLFNLSDWESRRAAAAETILAWKHLPPDERQDRVDDLAGRVPALPSALMMTKDQLYALAASPLATIGGHTRTHPILASISDSDAEEEIEGGKRDLEDLTQREITLFAYPNGKFGRDYTRPPCGTGKAGRVQCGGRNGLGDTGGRQRPLHDPPIYALATKPLAFFYRSGQVPLQFDVKG